jgi:hypothetical protein
MRKIIFLCVLLASCKKIDYAPPAPQISASGKLALWPIPTTGKVNMLINVEPNIKYNITIQSFNGKIVKSLGLSSVNSQIERVEDFSSLENGIYDLILIDIKGNEVRTPLIIKH